MIFSRARDPILTGHNIERVSENKYLGIWLNQKLTFKFHNNILVSKLRQEIGYLYRNRSTFPMFCWKWIIEAEILSVLDYDVIYRHASVSTLLDSVYRSTLRFNTGVCYSTLHCILYENMLGAAPLTVRSDSHWFLFLFKALKGDMPPFISSLFNQSQSHYWTCTSDCIMLKASWVKT